MANKAYTSIKSVLYDLSTLLPEEYWNETVLTEWAIKALRKINVHQKLEETSSFIYVENHKARLPKELKYLTQIAYKESFTEEELNRLQDIMGLTEDEWNVAVIKYIQDPLSLPRQALEASRNNSAYVWKPLRLASSHATTKLLNNSNILCEHEYSIDSDLCITTTLPKGIIWVSYLRYPGVDCLLIPDDEDLKEAILHYILYRIFLKKSMLMEESSVRERDYHLSRYQTLSLKASGKLNSPSVDELENIKNQRDSLNPKDNEYNSLFTSLNKNRPVRNYFRFK